MIASVPAVLGDWDCTAAAVQREGWYGTLYVCMNEYIVVTD